MRNQATKELQMKTDRQLEEDCRRKLRAARRVVIKLGTSLVTGEKGNPLTEHVALLVRSVSELRKRGRQIVLVSSGAVGLGRVRLGLDTARLGDLVTRQACAAVGQSLLMHAYEELFSAHDLKIAQLLLTEDDFANRRRYSNLRQAFEKLLKLVVIPIVNENDTVSTTEIEYLNHGANNSGTGCIFSDNDRLAALVMSKLDADALIILSDVDGLMSAESLARAPGQYKEKGAAIPLVTEMTSELKALANGPSANGRGGMVTKLEAAEIAMRAGGIAVIANGTKPDILDQIFAGRLVGTTFVSSSRIGGKRRWIKYAAGVRGKLMVNTGAQEAIVRGKASLLSSGVVRVEEQFKENDVVSIIDQKGREFARGIANYASQQAEEFICAAPSGNGQRESKAHVLVRRNNIVLTE